MPIPTTGAVDSAITETFEYVFFEGLGGFSSDVPFPWPISIGGRTFAIDLEHYQWALPDMVRQAIDFSAKPGEQSFDTGGVWLRSNGDWSLGAGQAYHDADGAEPRMFAASLGIDVWTLRQLTLLPDTEQLLASASAALRLLPHGEWLYVMDGEAQSLARTNNPQDNTPTFDTVTGGPATDFIDVATDGNNLYIATAAGIYQHTPTAGATMAAYAGDAGATVADLIRFANGWLLIGVGNVLSSIDAAGALTEVETHRVDAFVWAAIIGSPQGIYAGGQADDVAELVYIGFNADTGGLAVPIHAGELPRGEHLRSLAYYGSVLLIGTSKGFRIGNINGDNTLDIGPLIPTATDVLCAFGDSKFVYFGWSDYDSTHTGIGRANLAEFRSRSQPAYATDLMVADLNGAVTDVCRFADHTYFAVADSGFWREQADGNRVPSGSIRLGKVEWGTLEPKTFLGLQLTTLPLKGTVSASLEDDAGNVTDIGQLATVGSTGLGVLLGAGLGDLATFFEITLTLARPT